MHGGVSGQHIEARLWTYNITANSWSSVEFNDTDAVAGHTAVVVNNVMYIIFGHSPLYGYMNKVREVRLGEYLLSFTIQSNLSNKTTPRTASSIA